MDLLKSSAFQRLSSNRRDVRLSEVFFIAATPYLVGASSLVLVQGGSHFSRTRGMLGGFATERAMVFAR